MEHPKDIGDRTTLAVMLTLREAGYAISVPFGENTRYDLVIDDDDRLLRVQCKTGRLRLGAVCFATCSSYGHHRNPGASRRTYAGQIDLFAVYCPETAGSYLIPIADVPTQSSAMLRVDVARNRQRKRIRLASDYQIASIELPTPTLRQAPRASSGARGSSS